MKDAKLRLVAGVVHSAETIATEILPCHFELVQIYLAY
jgi:hypothetical protein